MASALLALLSRQTPSLQTRKGLVLVGLQNDLLPDGKLPVSIPPGYFDKLRDLVPAFREFGDIIWVRAEFEANRVVNSDEDGGDTVMIESVVESKYTEENEQDDERDSPVPPKRPRVSLEDTDHPMTPKGGDLVIGLPESAVDEELFLMQTDTKEACCLPGSSGAEFSPQVKDLIDPNKDMEVTSTHYSAFGSQSLLCTLRSKLITDLFICGGPTNLSVYATAMDAARYGLQITLIDDCLLARSKEKHDFAIERLREDIEADVMTSDEVINVLRNPPSPGEEVDYEDIYEDIDEDGYRDFEEEKVGVNDGTDDLDPLAVDIDEGTDHSILDPTRPVSSHHYGNLQSLRFTSPRARGSALAALLNGIQAVDSHRGTSESEAQSVAGKDEKLMEPQIVEVSTSDQLTDDESSNRVTMGDWLEHTRKSTKPSACSKHPGLGAIASLCGFDQKMVDFYEERMAEVKDARKMDAQALFGEEKEAERAGSCILYDLLTPDLAATVFDKLKDEVTWQRMHHQTGEVPRLVCCQGTIGEDGSMPVYRHPSDQTLPIQSWTSTVDQVRKAAEEAVGHPLNHALIQLYRGGTDYISEHSDKTLDIVKDSYIVNVSFGAQRTMRLRTKRAALADSDGSSPARTTYRVPMPHNSMIKMSLTTNAEYLHGINADKRPSVELSEAEKAFEGQRISLTFRNIGTFLNHDSTSIWGQGATGKTKDSASGVINADAVESERLVRAFGAENQASTLQWEAIYGDGFDVLHLK